MQYRTFTNFLSLEIREGQWEKKPEGAGLIFKLWKLCIVAQCQVSRESAPVLRKSAFGGSKVDIRLLLLLSCSNSFSSSCRLFSILFTPVSIYSPYIHEVSRLKNLGAGGGKRMNKARPLVLITLVRTSRKDVGSGVPI